MQPIQIALDGPSGSGKSTVAKRLAALLGIVYLDTGALYRAIGLKALRLGVDPRDEQAVAALMQSTRVDIRFAQGAQAVLLDGEDVTGEIRAHAVSAAASQCSQWPAVRGALLGAQRDIAARQSVVMDGRDIGTVVLPGARYKFFLTADLQTRAERRHAELLARGEQVSAADVLRDMRARDEADSSRAAAPLRRADDARLVDTTHMDIDQVVAHIAREVGA